MVELGGAPTNKRKIQHVRKRQRGASRFYSSTLQFTNFLGAEKKKKKRDVTILIPPPPGHVFLLDHIN